MPIRVVIADDQNVVRSGLAAYLTSFPHLHLIGEAEGSQELLELCGLVRPDVVLFGVNPPQADCINAIRTIHQRWPNIKILALTSRAEPEMVQLAQEAGASGCFSRNISANELAEAIQRAHQGLPELPQQVEQTLAQVNMMNRMEEDLLAVARQPSQFNKVLSAYLPQLFPDSRLHVFVFPDQDLYSHPVELARPVVGPAWKWLRTAEGPQIFLPGEEYPWGEEPDPDYGLLLAPIPASDGGKALGGVGLFNPGEPDLLKQMLPTLHSVAVLISSVVHQPKEQTNKQEQLRTISELEMAGRVQAGILPDKPPTLRGWDLAAHLEPARETSGDFYDFIPLPNNKWGFVIADVTDKGLGAAVFMALSSSLIRTYAVRYPTLPAIAFSSVNERIFSDTRGSLFVTAFYAILEPDLGRLRYVNAGHNPPLHLSIHKGKPVDRLSRTGMALGVSEEASWQQKIVKLIPGDLLVMYTDGITEAQNQNGEFFGEKRLLDAIRQLKGRPSKDILAALLARVREFIANSPFQDDIALIVLARKG
jgi:serine phosphatase RsbU (regulator of sigma subunit)/DNA-binding NarL/FixJ family response regulator